MPARHLWFLRDCRTSTEILFKSRSENSSICLPSANLLASACACRMLRSLSSVIPFYSFHSSFSYVSFSSFALLGLPDMLYPLPINSRDRTEYANSCNSSSLSATLSAVALRQNGLSKGHLIIGFFIFIRAHLWYELFRFRAVFVCAEILRCEFI